MHSQNTSKNVNLSAADIALLVKPYLLESTSVPPNLYDQLTKYLQLLQKWNARTNLTAIRDAEEIVLRHFGESIFAAQHIGNCSSLMDFGSGAGFPGLPIQLVHPNLSITLAESQNKKATFLREVARQLDLNTQVWGDRVEEMPRERQFDVVTLRAVDNMQQAVIAASDRALLRMLILTTSKQELPKLAHFQIENKIAIPGAIEQQLLLLQRQSDPQYPNVPRGT